MEAIIKKIVDKYTNYLEQGIVLREEIEKYMSKRVKDFCKEYNAHFISGNRVWGCQIKVSVSNNVEAIINLDEVFSPTDIFSQENWEKGGSGYIEKQFSPEEWAKYSYIEPEAIFYKACEYFQEILKEAELLSDYEHPTFKYLLEGLGDFGEEIKE